MTDAEAPLPLQDVRVIELGQLLAGPFCAQLLGDYGAEVIKVEEPRRGDPMREWGREKPHGKSLWWPVIARNKKSVTLNLRSEAGQQVLRDLVADADVLVENFRPGRMEAWGLGYDELAAINPRLILVRVTGFGQSGPYAERAGFGSIGEAMGGLRYIVGEPDGPPVRVGLSIGDTLAGTMGAMGALVALHARQSTGRGQLVDSAIFEAVLTYMESLIPEYDIAGYIRERTGAVLPNIAPSNVYPTSDDQMVLIGANQDLVFARLTEAMGQPELAQDPRFATHSARGANMEELDDLIGEWTATVTAIEILDLLHEHGVPAGRTYRAPDMLADPHFEARESIVTLEHPEFGPFRMQGVFPKLSETPGRVRSLGPELGQHNDEVLRGLLGLSDERIEAAQAT
jgi:formyl-CoA transferase